MTPAKKSEVKPTEAVVDESAAVEPPTPPALPTVQSPPASPSETEKWQAGVKAHNAEKVATTAAAEVKAATPRTPKKRRKPAWRETRWGTHPHYNCKFCHYSTFDLTAMAKHADAQHPEEE